jgi:signal transduction histidine kinase
LGEISFSSGANERLSNYLWFGNLNEMETVIARTLAVQRKTRLESSDLIFDFSVAEQVLEPPKLEEFVSLQTHEKKPRDAIHDPGKARNGSHKVTAMGNSHDKPELSLLIHELAHELKNPMVTIKTFAQLLSDRYQDEDFRTRFQDVVGGDIERMDELLELMIEFAEFSQPRWSKVPLEEKLRSALEEVASECARRQAQIRWKGNGYSREIRADESQLKYVLKNVLLAVLSQAKMGSEIEIDAEKQGSIAISYFREAGRVASITHYLGTSSPQANQSTLPLRILLAKQLVERNGGDMTFDYSDPERETLKLEFPIA